MGRTLYEAIGVARTATQAEIEKACLQFGDKYRPDKNPGDAEAARMFASFEEAFATLADPANRAAYDKSIQEGISDDSLPLTLMRKRGAATKDSQIGGPRLTTLLRYVAGLIPARWILDPWKRLAVVSVSFIAIFWLANFLINIASPPNIEPHCSMNGYGQVSCTFHNLGKVRGTTCAYVVLERLYGKGLYGTGLPAGTVARGGPICSGIVEPSDVKQIQQFTKFMTSDELSSYNPSEFCTGWETNEKVPWTYSCLMTIKNAN